MKYVFVYWVLFALPYCLTGADFIFITGGSGAGKTTFARALINELGQNQAFQISLDDYLDKRVQPQRDFIGEMPNFDHPSMINWQLVLQHIAYLQDGLSIEMPLYDFALWMPVGFKQVDWKPIIVMEGIHAMQDELDPIPGLRIFLDVTEELRYQRRLYRDVLERGYTAEMVEKIFFTMAAPYQKIFLDPTRSKANIVIEELDNQDYLEKAAFYVLEIFKKYRSIGWEDLKIRIRYDQGRLIEEQL